jgi:hypothetical protein
MILILLHYLRTFRRVAIIIEVSTFFKIDGWKDRRLHEYNLLIFIMWIMNNFLISDSPIDIKFILRQL